MNNTEVSAPIYVEINSLLDALPDVPYKESVRRVLLQAPKARVLPALCGSWEIDGCITRCSHCHSIQDSPLWSVCPYCGSHNS